jgi:hypothetical protein
LPDTDQENDRRRAGRQEFDNHRLLRLLREPHADAAPGSIDPALPPPAVTRAPSSWGAVVLAAFIFWALAVALVVLL